MKDALLNDGLITFGSYPSKIEWRWVNLYEFYIQQVNIAIKVRPVSQCQAAWLAPIASLLLQTPGHRVVKLHQKYYSLPEKREITRPRGPRLPRHSEVVEMESEVAILTNSND
ncbi:hypothetical protein VN97_g5131 [Penicillium thymicola]|uniref:Uncharacterized protein n=1 Tax=Penicillium thymicola TaxID=293382 RepID=A0AAI9TJ99_PENTH|nr:hypothetical protein VN97_g5131 [Penicillium thymicola]